MPTTEKPGLTRDAIKYLAIFTMLLNHIANVLLPENTILWEVFIDIGYFTAITMCYFLVEGFYYTHSRRKYGERLLIFAGISQVPYMIAFGNSQLNMIFTLFICFMILVVQERMMASKWRIPLLILLLLLSVYSDWAILAPVFTIWFHESWGADLADLGTVMPNVYHTKEEMIDCVNAFYDGMVQRSEEMKQHPNYKTGENYAYLGLQPCRHKRH